MQCAISDIKEFNSIIGLLLNFNENVKFQCTEQGIMSQCLANAATCIVKISIDPKYFVSYTCEKDHVIGINIKLLHTILKKCSKEDSLSLQTKDNILVMTISNESNMTTYEIKMIDLEQDLLDIPELDYNFSAIVNPTVLKTWKDMVDITGESIGFEPKIVEEQSIMEITSENDTNNMKRLEKMTFNIFEEPQAFKLSHKSMTMICSMMIFKKELSMSYQNNTPIEFSFDLDNVKIESWFAPMMDLEED